MIGNLGSRSVDWETGLQTGSAFPRPFVERERQRICYEETGSGPAILLGHGFFCSGEIWRYQVPELAQFYRVINPDYRGHGRSSPLREELGLDDLVDGESFPMEVHFVHQNEGVTSRWSDCSFGRATSTNYSISCPRSRPSR
ncbi:MAG: alpha/beta fold hydrolase [Thermoanaerobaculia bacterium]